MTAVSSAALPLSLRPWQPPCRPGNRVLTSALESTTDAVIALDRGWRITYLNQHAKSQQGLDGDVLGKVIWTVLQREDGVFTEACQVAMERGEPTRVTAYSTPMDKHWDVHI